MLRTPKEFIRSCCHLNRFPRIYLLILLFLLSTGCSQLFNEKPLPTFIAPLQVDNAQVTEIAGGQDATTAVSTLIPTVRAISNPTTTPTQLPTNTPEPTATPTETPVPSPTPLPIRIESRAATMVLIDGDEFITGANTEWLMTACQELSSGCVDSIFAASNPIHSVQLDAFYIDIYEISNNDYVTFLTDLGGHAGVCRGENCLSLNDSQIGLTDKGEYFITAEWSRHPVAGATWYGAAAYCEWRDARLPSEAEWEVAASWDPIANVQQNYPWGDEFEATAVNFCDTNCAEPQAFADGDDGNAVTAPVGSYLNGRSPFGVFDMGGNVWEWVNDWYAPDYYAESPLLNPTGPEAGDAKVVHGGSWFDTGNYMASAIRFPAPPTESGDSIGFRCVQDALPADGQILAQADTNSESDAEAETQEATPVPTQEPTPQATATSADSGQAVATQPGTTTTHQADCSTQPGVDLGDTYIVGICDWFSKIANTLGIDYHILLAANPQIANPELIYPSQILTLPPRDGQPAPPPASGSGGLPSSGDDGGLSNP